MKLIVRNASTGEVLREGTISRNNLDKDQKSYWMGGKCYALNLWVEDRSQDTLIVLLGPRDEAREKSWADYKEKLIQLESTDVTQLSQRIADDIDAMVLKDLMKKDGQ